MPKSWICIDANLVVRLAINPTDVRIRELWQDWLDNAHQLIAPLLLRYEVTNAFHRYRVAGIIDDAKAEEAMGIAFALPIRLYRDASLHAQALRIAGRFALPAAYDAHYVALAEREQAEFWTTDQRLVNVVGASLSWIHLASL